MKSGKSEALLSALRCNQIADDRDGLSEPSFLALQPRTNTRDVYKEGPLKGQPYINSRASNGEKVPAIYVPNNHPDEIFNLVGEKRAVFIEEGHMFGLEANFDPTKHWSLDHVVMALVEGGVDVTVSALDTDFAGRYFGVVSNLVGFAQYAGEAIVHKEGVCDIRGCRTSSTRTQRLRNGKPVTIADPVLSPEGAEEGVIYEARCFDHHELAPIDDEDSASILGPQALAQRVVS